MNALVLRPVGISALSRRGKAFIAMYRLHRASTLGNCLATRLFRMSTGIGAKYGEPETPFILFMARNYFRLTFRCEGKKIRLLQ